MPAPHQPSAARAPLTRTAFRGWSALCVAALAASSLAACTPQAPDPAPTARVLADALRDGDLTDVPLADGDAAAATAALEEAFGNLGDATRTVTVEEVAVDENTDGTPTATARLRTVWDLDGPDASATPAAEGEASDGEASDSGAWSYTTEATMEYDDDADAWEVRYEPAVAVPGLRDGESLRLRTVPAARGDILGAGDRVLVTDRAVVRLGIDKSLIDAAQAGPSARRLAALVEIDAGDYAARVGAAGAQAFVEAIVLRDDQSLEVTAAEVAEIPGARALEDRIPLAPTRTFARAVLGSVGEATAELVEQSGGRLSAGDTAGLSGLQAAYDERLAGTPGRAVWTVPSPEGTEDAADPRLLFERPAVDGEPVETTLDAPMQTLAERVLAGADSPSAIVALRPSDGAVLAAANGPATNAFNTAMLGQYAPGSTFKVVTALAMLRSGYTPASTVECPQTTVVDGRSFKNYTGYPEDGLGAITLAEAIAQSCNTVFIQASDDVPMSAVAEAAGSLGLAEEPSVGAAAFLGSVPADATGTEHAANMIGQGVVQASVLGMATVAASVSAGSTVRPRLVEDPEPAAGPAPEVPLTAGEAEQLLSMMGGTVDHGTVTDLRDVPGPPVAAKTGTAEYGDGSEDLRHTWVIAVQGDLAVAAFVETGFSGAETGGPLIKEFLTGAQELGSAGG
ncbi:MAG: penicillin-binding transpeptidase domain-containing protein [Arthrobacter sp.]|uniref:penicillin-binding transpeptidase domain-containing protein n=1 Tax=Arthrobacter sp. TaxID=1667 RepID=UPI003496A11F